MGTKFGHCPSRKERFRDECGRADLPPFFVTRQETSMESLWMDGLYVPAWVDEERRNSTVVHSCEAEANKKAISDFVALLRACTRNKDICVGQKIHDEILERGLLKDCSDVLVTMYAKCGALAMAQQLLDAHGSKSVCTWTALIAAYTRKGQGLDAINCFERMRCNGLTPDAVTFTCILKACGIAGAVDKGQQVHDAIAQQGLLAKNVLLGNSLVAMYAKCSLFEKARNVLEELPVRTASPWNALIGAFLEQGRGREALECFKEMQQVDVSPDAVTYICVLKACGSMGALDRGVQIHDEIIARQLMGSHVVLDNAVVSMYAKCRALTKARQVLEEIPIRDAVSWNALLAGYSQEGQNELVLSCFDGMQCDGVLPSPVTFAFILKACGNLGAMERAEKIHKQISKEGMLAKDDVLGTALVDVYAKCGALSKAHSIFEELPFRDVTSWNALIAGFVEHGECEKALLLFERLQREDLSPNALTLSYTLKACRGIGAEGKGLKLHDMIAKRGSFRDDIVLGTVLMDMYCKCGALEKSRKVFEELSVRDRVCWSALIVGYAENNKSEQALECFEMMQSDGIFPDAVTYVCTLKACGCLRSVDKGATIHDMIMEQGLLGNNIVLGTALLYMYIKCGALCKARQVFEELPARNVVTWNALISGYADHGNCEEALAHFQKMQYQGLSPDAVTYICLLKACSNVGAPAKGEGFHNEITQQSCWENNIVLGTAVVNMYAKCGALAKARKVLEELPVRDSISWNALITGYVRQGKWKHVTDCFEWMQQDGIFPDAATFSCMLIACSRLGLVEEARLHFVDMSTKYGIYPDLEHYVCMVDVFLRAGFLTEAFRLIDYRIPICSFDLWSNLLTACQKWGAAKAGRWAFEYAIQGNLTDTASYMLVAGNHAPASLRETAGNINFKGFKSRAKGRCKVKHSLGRC